MDGFEFPAPLVEPTPRRIRVRLRGDVVADSSRALLLVQYGPRDLPTYYLSRDDVRRDALVEETTGPDGRRRWAVRSPGGRVEAAAWTHPDPTGPMSALDGHITF